MDLDLDQLKAPFPEQDIEWRVGQCGKNSRGVWATCLAYIQARAIQDRLDQAVGPGNWKVAYRVIPASDRVEPGVICELSIQVSEGVWVTKEDGAEQTDIESFKGGLSSALKRAAVAWGIGRYLYDLDQAYAKITENKNDRWGKTKDGTEFHWTPPALPAWATPKVSTPAGPAPARASAPVSPQPAAAAETNAAKPKTRVEVIAEIMTVSGALKCSRKEMTEWAAEMFKKPIDRLSDQELQKFLETLQHELGRKGAVA